MNNKYDAIIIGAGISGLGVGALLAKAGKKVKVLEKSNYVGGRAANFNYKGYTLGIGTHGGFEDGKFDELITMLGKDLPERIEIDLPKLYRFDTHEAVDAFTFIDPNNPEVLQLGQAFMSITEENLPEYDEISAHEWLSGIVSDQTIYDLVSWLGVILTCMPNMKKLAASSLIEAIRKMFTMPQTFIPVNGYNEYCNVLADVIKENDGELETGVNITQIIIKDKCVQGIVIEENDELQGSLGKAARIEAPVVITAFPIWDLFNITNEDHFSKKFIEDVKFHDKRSANIGIIAGMKEPLYKEKFFYLAKMPRSNLLTLIFMISNIAPSYAPEGEHLMELVGICEHDISKDRESMHETIEYLKQDLEEIFPGWEEKTIWTKNYFHWVDPARTPGRHGKFRIGPKSNDVNGLYFTGDSVSSRVAPGMECASDSAMICAKEILGELPKH